MPAVVSFPAAETPRVSIAIVLYRGGRHAVAALAAVAAHTTVPYEVIVIDNASPDASGALVRLRSSGARFVVNDTNRGFGGAMNQAVGLARADAVCLMNPDVEVGPGWLEPLLVTLGSFDRCAAVSPVLLHPDGSVQEAGARIDSTGHTHPLTEPEAREVDYASAACLVVRRGAFLELGGFDDRYHPAYFEDADLALRWRAAGWSVRVEPSSRVVHHRGGTDLGGAATRIAGRSLQVFRARWAAELATR